MSAMAETCTAFHVSHERSSSLPIHPLDGHSIQSNMHHILHFAFVHLEGRVLGHGACNVNVVAEVLDYLDYVQPLVDAHTLAYGYEWLLRSDPNHWLLIMVLVWWQTDRQTGKPRGEPSAKRQTYIQTDRGKPMGEPSAKRQMKLYHVSFSCIMMQLKLT